MSELVKATKKEIIISSVLIAFAMALILAEMMSLPHLGTRSLVASISRISLFVSIIFGFRGIVYASPRGAYSPFNTQAIAGVIGTLFAVLTPVL